MRLSIDKNLNYDQDKLRLASEFVIFCVDHLPIEGDCNIYIVADRDAHGITTTAVYQMGKNVCKIYGKNRAFVDVLRSIAHEMTHMMQDEMGLLTGHIRDAGGFHEDQANAKAGELIKLFAKSKKDRKAIYENKKINEVSIGVTDHQSGRKVVRSDKVTVDNDDFESGKVSMNDGIKWGQGEGAKKRAIAFRALSYFLPNGAKLTSCYRSLSDQERIIKNYAKKYGYTGDLNDFDAMHAFTKTKGLIIARRPGTGHGGKNDTAAFDFSGVSLDKIWKGVENANSKLAGKMKFAPLTAKRGYRSIIERENNAVHVHFNLKDVKLSESDIESLKKESEPEKSDSE